MKRNVLAVISTRQGIDLSHLPGIQPQTLRSWVLSLNLAYRELSCATIRLMKNQLLITVVIKER